MIKPVEALVGLAMATLVVGGNVAGAPAASASVAAGAPLTHPVRPANVVRGLYVTETACQIAGGAGFSRGEWTVWTCVPTPVEGDDEPWYRLITDR